MRMLRGGPHRQYGDKTAVRVLMPSPVENALTVLPSNVEAAIRNFGEANGIHVSAGIGSVASDTTSGPAPLRCYRRIMPLGASVCNRRFANSSFQQIGR